MHCMSGARAADGHAGNDIGRKDHMARAEIDLTEQESEALRALAQGSGTTPDALLREAVEQLISQSQPGDWRTALHQARGMWKDRSDLPSLAELRDELDRF